MRDAAEAAIRDDIEGYLASHEQKELVRFTTVGSVDDGKSTLIGRLLHDTFGIFDDQLAAVKRASAKNAEEIDFSLFTDGLKAEREQGITIDVAYRYFSTDKRKFIIADTPGHVQYTRNMATGASTADVAVILLDARLGVLPQSRRHAYIASLLGIPELAVAVNKMDLVAESQARFDELVAEFGAFAAPLGFRGVTFLPVSAKRGDNVVARSERMPWYTGPTLLEYLEVVPVARDTSREPWRLPVQLVLRPHLDYRAFAGQIASGVVRPGDEIIVLPSGRRTRVRAIDTWEGELVQASAPQSVALRLTDEVDVSRGDMLVRPDELPRVARRFEAMLVWMSEQALDPARKLLLKHTTRTVPARLERIVHRVDLDTLGDAPAAALALNDIARVELSLSRPIFCDPYRDNRTTGAFILIDALTNDTVAAGMIVSFGGDSGGAGAGPVTASERRERMGQRGAARAVATRAEAESVERALFQEGWLVVALDALALPAAEARGQVERLVAAGLAVVVATPAPEGLGLDAGGDAATKLREACRVDGRIGGS